MGTPMRRAQGGTEIVTVGTGIVTRRSRGRASSPFWRGRIEEGVGGVLPVVGGDPLPALPLTRGRKMWVLVVRRARGFAQVFGSVGFPLFFTS
jgi:hypothetical protein